MGTINLIILHFASRSTARGHDIDSPLVAPELETPSPDIYFQRVLSLDVGRDSKRHLGLLFKGGSSTSQSALICHVSSWTLVVSVGKCEDWKVNGYFQ